MTTSRIDKYVSSGHFANRSVIFGFGGWHNVGHDDEKNGHRPMIRAKGRRLAPKSRDAMLPVTATKTVRFNIQGYRRRVVVRSSWPAILIEKIFSRARRPVDDGIRIPTSTAHRGFTRKAFAYEDGRGEEAMNAADGSAGARAGGEGTTPKTRDARNNYDGQTEF